MTRDELEFAISQYLDGNLPEAEESALESRLATDAGARTLLAEYRTLDRVLRAAPLPAIDYDALAGRISGAVAAREEPAQSYRLHWVRTVSALALAACVVIALSLGIRRLQSPAGPRPAEVAVGHSGADAEPRHIVVVDAIPRALPSTQPVVAVAVGPSGPQDRSPAADYAEDLLSRPSQVIIARGGDSEDDGAARDLSGLPY